jgi:hypothetical protein
VVVLIGDVGDVVIGGLVLFGDRGEVDRGALRVLVGVTPGGEQFEVVNPGRLHGLAGFGSRLRVGAARDRERDRTLDQTAPVTTSSLAGTTTGCGSFYGTSVTVALAATDGGSGVVSTTYQVDGGTAHTYAAPFAVTGLGSHAVTFRSVDHAGNVEATRTTTVAIVAPAVTPTPSSGTVGTAVTVIGSNFESGETVNVYRDSTSSTPLLTATADGRGCAFRGQFVFTSSVSGAHQLIAVGQTSGKSATGTFTVVAKAAMSPASGPVGTHSVVRLTGFKAGQAVTIHWKTPTGTVLGSATVDTLGNAEVSIVVPADANGAHGVYAETTAGPNTSATFTVAAAESLSLTTGPVGTHLVVTLSGFTAAQSITLHWKTPTGTTLGTDTAGTLGGAAVNVVVPADANGAHGIYAETTDGPNTSANFTITAAASLSPTSGPAGTHVVVTLSGFKAAQAITIHWNTPTGTVLATATAGTLGGAAANITIPTDTSGAHAVDAQTAAGPIATATFTET